jgi:hypothetical protein
MKAVRVSRGRRGSSDEHPGASANVIRMFSGMFKPHRSRANLGPSSRAAAWTIAVACLKHLGALRRAGFVSRRGSGAWVCYEFDERAVDLARTFLGAVMNSARTPHEADY